MPENNMFVLSSDSNTLLPTKDMVMGIYYLTLSNDIDSGITLNGYRDIEKYIELKIINENDVVTLNIDARSIKTTIGRLMIWKCLPNCIDIDFETVFNKKIDKQVLISTISFLCSIRSNSEICLFLDRLKEIAFKYSTKSGVSISCSDVPSRKMSSLIIDDTRRSEKEIKDGISAGLLSRDEGQYKIISNWARCIDSVKDLLIEDIRSNKNDNDLSNVTENDIAIMLDSGARGSKSQIQQMFGLRGFIAKTSGEIHDRVIDTSLLDGLSSIDYFYTTHGERKGLSDTAFKTAKAGYFTRRLVYSAQSSSIGDYDCNSVGYIEFDLLRDKIEFGYDFSYHIIGRNLAVDLSEKYRRNDEITAEMIEFAINSVSKLCVRSPIFCQLEHNSICFLCYGTKFSESGLCVGMIAATGIGEVGTQLTLRTIHSSGSVRDKSETEVSAVYDGYLDLSGANYAVNSKGDKVIIEDSNISVRNSAGREIYGVSLPFSSIVTVDDKVFLKVGDIISTHSNIFSYSISRKSGILRINFKDSKGNKTVSKNIDRESGITITEAILNTHIDIMEEGGSNILESIEIPRGSIFMLRDMSKISSGDFIAKKRLDFKIEHSDITGGLSRVIGILEVKKPNKLAFISPVDGIIRRKKTGLEIGNNLFKVGQEVLNRLRVQEGRIVKKGQILTEGEVYLQDLLKVLGINYTVKFMLSSIFNVYEDQGVLINSRHLEVILKQNFRKVRSGPKIYSLHDALRNGIKDYEHILIGITKVSSDFSDSFLSSASFQYTIRSLANSSVTKSIDHIRGLKEKVIVCKLLNLKKDSNES